MRWMSTVKPKGICNRKYGRKKLSRTPSFDIESISIVKAKDYGLERTCAPMGVDETGMVWYFPCIIVPHPLM